MSPYIWSHARWIGLLIGAALAATFLYTWTVPGGTGSQGAALTVKTTLSRDIAIEPAGPVLSASDLRPSAADEGVAGSFSARNATGERQTVRMRALPEGGDLDDTAAVELRAGEQTLFEGRLRELRHGTKPFILDAGTSTTISIRAWIPGSVREGYQARADTVALELLTEGAASP